MKRFMVAAILGIMTLPLGTSILLAQDAGNNGGGMGLKGDNHRDDQPAPPEPTLTECAMLADGYVLACGAVEPLQACGPMTRDGQTVSPSVCFSLTREQMLQPSGIFSETLRGRAGICGKVKDDSEKWVVIDAANPFQRRTICINFD